MRVLRLLCPAPPDVLLVLRQHVPTLADDAGDVVLAAFLVSGDLVRFEEVAPEEHEWVARARDSGRATGFDGRKRARGEERR